VSFSFSTDSQEGMDEGDEPAEADPIPSQGTFWQPPVQGGLPHRIPAPRAGDGTLNKESALELLF
jgi:hypothetical protein